MELGTVSSRVALLLRSAEVKPLFYRFVQLLLNSSLSLPPSDFRAGPVGLVLWSGDALGRRRGKVLDTGSLFGLL